MLSMDLELDVSEAQLARYAAFAAREGLSLDDFFLKAIDEYIERTQQG